MDGIVSIYRDCTLLPHFLTHCRRLGVDRVLGIVYEAGDDMTRRVAAAAAPFGNYFLSAVASNAKFDCLTNIAQENALRSAGRWYFRADLDEFPVADLSDLARRADALGLRAVQGQMVDRVAADGSLPAIDPARPLGDQFPLKGRITGPLLGACDVKVFLVKGDTPLGMGGHHQRGGTPMRSEAEVHHFKWSAGVIDRLRERIAHYQRIGMSHWAESAKFLAHYDANGRIDTERCGFRPAGGPEFPPGG